MNIFTANNYIYSTTSKVVFVKPIARFDEAFLDDVDSIRATLFLWKQ